MAETRSKKAEREGEIEAQRNARRYWENKDRQRTLAPIPVLAQRAGIVTICGSSKFKAEILSEVARLTTEGKLVISLGLFGHHDLPDYNWDTDASDLKTMLDALHRQKIDMADSVHVVNPGGYYGESTTREIDYALSLGLPVTYMVSGHERGSSPAPEK